jgi:dTDP-4-amino-4,6-dideoxygalactose transaminase
VTNKTFIPFVDLKQQTKALEEEIKEAISGVVSRCDFILGESVDNLERAFAAYVGCTEAVGVSSGLDALTLALRALNIHEGDEVILPANTFIATSFAASAVGATPVFVDCEENYNIDCSKIESAITERTKVIIPVHLTGQPCDMQKIMDIAGKHGLHVVEDAAQAHGAAHGNKSCGSIGNFGCFSFYPGKNLGAFGDGGMVTTNDAGAAEKIRHLRNYGQEVKYEHIYIGSNKRLDTMQASILSVKLKHLDSWNDRRIENSRLYDKLIRDVEEVRTPPLSPGCRHVFHLYMIACEKRDALQKFLNDNGIQTGIHYPIPIHLQKCYKELGHKRGDFPVAERLSDKILSLPMFPELTEAQIQYVATRIKEFYLKS